MKILFAGIDGSGKTTCLDLLISQLAPEYKILTLSKAGPHVVFKGEKQLAVKHNLNWLIDATRPISRRHRFFGFFLLMNYIYRTIVANYLGHSIKDVDIVMYDSDTLLHPAVYMTFHLPFSRCISRRMRVRLASIVFGSKRRFLTFYLDADPNIAVERIRKRGGNIDTHENVKDLESLKEEFDKMISVASEGGFNIVKINTDNKSAEDVTNEIYMVVKRELGNSAGATSYGMYAPEASESS